MYVYHDKCAAFYILAYYSLTLVEFSYLHIYIICTSSRLLHSYIYMHIRVHAILESIMFQIYISTFKKKERDV